MNKEQIASSLEHTLLKPAATAKDIEILCQEALTCRCLAVCVNSNWVQLAASLLNRTSCFVVSTASFPLGASATPVKAFEVDFALSQGALEVDFVLNIGWLKSQEYQKIMWEFAELVQIAEKHPLKVILETSLLTSEEKRIACQLAADSGIAFVKTSTGFGQSGATIEDIILMKETVLDKAQVKASGGIRDLKSAMEMLKAGAARIGTSSAPAIIADIK